MMFHPIYSRMLNVLLLACAACLLIAQTTPENHALMDDYKGLTYILWGLVASMAYQMFAAMWWTIYGDQLDHRTGRAR